MAEGCSSLEKANSSSSQTNFQVHGQRPPGAPCQGGSRSSEALRGSLSDEWWGWGYGSDSLGAGPSRLQPLLPVWSSPFQLLDEAHGPESGPDLAPGPPLRLIILLHSIPQHRFFFWLILKNWIFVPIIVNIVIRASMSWTYHTSHSAYHFMFIFVF